MKKTILPLVCAALMLLVFSCKKEKCSYYNDINDYYDLSVQTWTQQYEQGIIDSVDWHNQMYKIERERATLQKQNKDCVE